MLLSPSLLYDHPSLYLHHVHIPPYTPNAYSLVHANHVYILTQSPYSLALSFLLYYPLPSHTLHITNLENITDPRSSFIDHHSRIPYFYPKTIHPLLTMIPTLLTIFSKHTPPHPPLYTSIPLDIPPPPPHCPLININR